MLRTTQDLIIWKAPFFGGVHAVPTSLGEDWARFVRFEKIGEIPFGAEVVRVSAIGDFVTYSYGAYQLQIADELVAFAKS
jgi:hypothetical protein